ncbi:unnamed protein product [Mucor fragilis]
MTFPHKQGGFLAWLQSDIDDFSLFLNQQDQDPTNVTEAVDLFSASDEETMENIWNNNQDAEIATKDYLDCAIYVGEAYYEGIICDQLLSEPEAIACTKPVFVTDWCSFVESVDKIISTDALIQPFTQKPYYSPTLDYSAYVPEIVLDNKQQMEQANKGEQLLFDKDVLLKELEWSNLEEIQKNAFNDKDSNTEIPGGLQYDLLYIDGVPPMFEHDQGGKEFSSWLIYGDNNDIVAFEDVSSNDASEDSPQPIATSAHNRSSAIAKPNEDSHDRNSNEHIVCDTEPHANGASSSGKTKSNTAGNRLSTRPLSSRGTMLYYSHLQPRRQTPLFDYSDLFNADSSNQGTLANRKRAIIDEDNHVV